MMRIKPARFSVILSIFWLLTILCANSLCAAPTGAGDSSSATAPVRIDGKMLFTVRGISAYPAQERAAVIASRITEIADDAAVSSEAIAPVESDHSTDIMAGDRLIMSVFDVDAAPEGVTRQVLAKAYAFKIRKAVDTYRQDRVSGRIMRGAGSALGITVLFIAVILLAGRAFRWFSAAVEARLASKIESLQDKSHDIVRAEWLRAALRVGLQTARITLILLLFIFYVDLVLSLFPWTRRYTIPLLELVFDPLRSIGGAALGFVPNLVFLIVLAIITRYGLGLLKAFFLGVQRGMIKISGFDVDWALPVYKLTRLGIIAFTVVVAYPYIPGSESPAFKGVSLFLGVVFSLGSSSSISNIVAGYMVIFRRAFRVGDRVRIGQHSGDVIELRLQATHLRTVKNEEVVVPNSLILSTEVINYSSLARKGGLILHTTVTIGYDTPWRQVHALLLEAASRTEGLLHKPEPFVLQTALNDFYVSYELNVATDLPSEMTRIYSDLHQNIQDAFNKHGVQIMSPHYLGDPAQAKIVPPDKWYQAPAKQNASGGGA
jgi:small-conductance mechanosensitive channel